jgi:hypothetical protein
MRSAGRKRLAEIDNAVLTVTGGYSLLGLNKLDLVVLDGDVHIKMHGYR